MKRFGEDFRKDVEINKFKLEEECEIQAAMYYHYAELSANARNKRDAAKDRLDLIIGQTDLSIRRNPPNDIKVTEAAISALINESPSIRDAKENLLAAQAEVDTLYAATTALDHRRSQLDNLVHLWTKNYYSDRTKSDDADAIRDRLNKEED